MSQVPVKWVHDDLLFTVPPGDIYDNYVPVVPLTALREVVEGLKAIETHCDRIAVLSKCPGSSAEAQMAQIVAQRLLAQLGEPTDPSTKGKSHE